MKNPHLVTQALMVVLICINLYAQFRPATPAAPGGPVRPAAPTELESAAVQYRDYLGTNFAVARDNVRSRKIATKEQGTAVFASARKRLGDALNAAFDAHCDKDGNITDPDGLVADLDRPARALGAK